MGNYVFARHLYRYSGLTKWLRIERTPRYVDCTMVQLDNGMNCVCNAGLDIRAETSQYLADLP